MESQQGKTYTREELGKLSKKKLIQLLLNEEDESATNKRKLSAMTESDQVSGAAASNKKRKTKELRAFDFSKHSKRHIALKIAYLGWDYIGLAYQKHTPLPTVEGKIFEALIKTRLIESIETCNFSRAGRTDKGVSAFTQVLSVTVRSNLKDGVGMVSVGSNHLPQEEPEAAATGGDQQAQNKKQQKREPATEEIPYVQMLNKVLPDDIRALGWSPVEPTFDARFSAKSRTYKYFFFKESLDIEAMREAAQYFVGVHDFRNFCRMDAENVSNYVRTLLSFEIEPANDSVDPNAWNKMYNFKINGFAFLWHQVRCMTAILFLVGKGLEKPTIIRDLLDLNKHPKKPVYDIASEIPLVLYDCGYENLTFINDVDAQQSIIRHFNKSWMDIKMRSTVVWSMIEGLENAPVTTTESDIPVRYGDVKSVYEPEGEWRYVELAKRPTGNSYEEKRALIDKKRGTAKEDQPAEPMDE